MKLLSEMNQKEINSLSDEEFKAISPFEKRTCNDCKSLKSALSLWCVNKNAIADRGTSFPGCIKCPHWTPNWGRISKKYKTEENGYVRPLKRLTNSITKKLK